MSPSPLRGSAQRDWVSDAARCRRSSGPADPGRPGKCL